MTEKDAERQFEIEASTMDRQQLYDLAKRQAVKISELEARIRQLEAYEANKSYAENDSLRRELAEARAEAKNLQDIIFDSTDRLSEILQRHPPTWTKAPEALIQLVMELQK